MSKPSKECRFLDCECRAPENVKNEPIKDDGGVTNHYPKPNVCTACLLANVVASLKGPKAGYLGKIPRP